MVRQRLVALALFATSLAGPALTQQASDGSLEETYAKECPRHQDTQMCNTLRKALVEAASKDQPTAITAPTSNPTHDMSNDGTRQDILDAAAGDQKRNRRLSLIRVGEEKEAAFDRSDRSSMLVWKDDCYRIVANPGQHLWIAFYVNGIRSQAVLRETCEDLGPIIAMDENAGDRRDVHFRFWQGNAPLYAVVSGRGAVGKAYRAKLVRMTPAQVAEWREEIQRARINKQNAARRDSGLFGALTMATGAALAGGNAEIVMGAAMKGAELTTDNEMSRNVLAGQGDKMITDGVQRTADDVARHNRGAIVQAGIRAPSDVVAQMTAQRAPGAAASRMGYYACNAFNVSTRVTYYSPIVARPYDDQSWLRRLADDFASLTARFYPGEYHGGGATCWARRSQAEAADEIAQAKRWAAANYGDRTARDVIEWAPPEP